MALRAGSARLALTKNLRFSPRLGDEMIGEKITVAVDYAKSGCMSFHALENAVLSKLFPGPGGKLILSRDACLAKFSNSLAFSI